MSELCKWLHEQLDQLSMITHPFNLEDLPQNGIYFFYEKGEVWGHVVVSPKAARHPRAYAVRCRDTELPSRTADVLASVKQSDARRNVQWLFGW